MSKAVAMLLLAVLANALGCTSQACRPCGPGFLGNVFVPQGIAGVDFRDACRQHDHCYGTDCPRKECDVTFRDNMLCACECSTHPTLCKMRAWEWFLITRIGGGPGYGPTECDGSCDCCCCDEGTEPNDAPLADTPAGDDEIATATIE